MGVERKWRGPGLCPQGPAVWTVTPAASFCLGSICSSRCLAFFLLILFAKQAALFLILLAITVSPQTIPLVSGGL